MSKLNERLTLFANLAVVAGIVILAVEMRQNTRAIQAQTRDSMTEKQMELSGWFATSPDLAAAWAKAYDSALASWVGREVGSIELCMARRASRERRAGNL